jgi:molybdopterin converting factor small subunit
MKIFVQIAGLIEGEHVVGEQEVEIKNGSTVKDLIKAGDKLFNFKKKYFKLLTRQGRLPTILLNGDRLDLPEGYSQKLLDGEKISILLPFSGG